MNKSMEKRMNGKMPVDNIRMIARIARSQSDLIEARTGTKYADTIKAFRDQADMLDLVAGQLMSPERSCKTCRNNHPEGGCLICEEGRCAVGGVFSFWLPITSEARTPKETKECEACDGSGCVHCDNGQQEQVCRR